MADIESQSSSIDMWFMRDVGDVVQIARRAAASRDYLNLYHYRTPSPEGSSRSNSPDLHSPSSSEGSRSSTPSAEPNRIELCTSPTAEEPLGGRPDSPSESTAAEDVPILEEELKIESDEEEEEEQKETLADVFAFHVVLKNQEENARKRQLDEKNGRIVSASGGEPVEDPSGNQEGNVAEEPSSSGGEPDRQEEAPPAKEEVVEETPSEEHTAPIYVPAFRPPPSQLLMSPARQRRAENAFSHSLLCSPFRRISRAPPQLEQPAATASASSSNQRDPNPMPMMLSPRISVPERTPRESYGPMHVFLFPRSMTASGHHPSNVAIFVESLRPPVQAPPPRPAPCRHSCLMLPPRSPRRHPPTDTCASDSLSSGNPTSSNRALVAAPANPTQHRVETSTAGTSSIAPNPTSSGPAPPEAATSSESLTSELDEREKEKQEFAYSFAMFLQLTNIYIIVQADQSSQDEARAATPSAFRTVQRRNGNPGPLIGREPGGLKRRLDFSQAPGPSTSSNSGESPEVEAKRRRFDDSSRGPLP